MKNIKFEDVLKIKKELKNVKPKENLKSRERELNLKTTIFELGAELETMRANGYNYAEIVEMLKQHNVLIGKQTLSKYLSEFKNKDAPAAIKEPPVIVAGKPELLPPETEPDLYYPETEYELDYNAADVMGFDEM